MNKNTCTCGNLLTITDPVTCSECRRSGKPITNLREALAARDCNALRGAARRLRGLGHKVPA